MALNKFIFHGRLTRDVELYKTAQNLSVASLTVAMSRPKLEGVEEATTDFIDCVAYGKLAENLSRFTSKGSEILVSGVVQTGSYTNKENQKIKKIVFIIKEFDFCGNKQKKEEVENPPVENAVKVEKNLGTLDVPDDDLPF